jgi:hypothetical protein
LSLRVVSRGAYKIRPLGDAVGEGVELKEETLLGGVGKEKVEDWLSEGGESVLGSKAEGEDELPEGSGDWVGGEETKEVTVTVIVTVSLSKWNEGPEGVKVGRPPGGVEGQGSPELSPRGLLGSEKVEGVGVAGNEVEGESV